MSSYEVRGTRCRRELMGCKLTGPPIGLRGAESSAVGVLQCPPPCRPSHQTQFDAPKHVAIQQNSAPHADIAPTNRRPPGTTGLRVLHKPRCRPTENVGILPTSYEGTPLWPRLLIRGDALRPFDRALANDIDHARGALLQACAFRSTSEPHRGNPSRASLTD